MGFLNFTTFPVLTSDRLVLRQLITEDEKEIFSLRTNEIVNRHLDRPIARSIEDAQDFIKKINFGVNANEWLYWGISFKNEQSIIGTICLWNFSEEENKAEIGYELLPQYHGKAIMQEALQKVIDFGFTTLQLTTIEAWTTARNTASIKMLERNGFKKDYEAENKIDRAIEGIDRIIFTLSKNDYSIISHP
jgi:[ribosomal protein S5]-alanine N-acetyltransferase